MDCQHLRALLMLIKWLVLLLAFKYYRQWQEMPIASIWRRINFVPPPPSVCLWNVGWAQGGPSRATVHRRLEHQSFECRWIKSLWLNSGLLGVGIIRRAKSRGPLEIYNDATQHRAHAHEKWGIMDRGVLREQWLRGATRRWLDERAGTIASRCHQRHATHLGARQQCRNYLPGRCRWWGGWCASRMGWGGPFVGPGLGSDETVIGFGPADGSCIPPLHNSTGASHRGSPPSGIRRPRSRRCTV